MADQLAKKGRIRKTLYWAISLDPDEILNHQPIKELLNNKPELIPLQKMHSTLLFVGRKDNLDENVFTEHLFRKCQLIITGHGCSDQVLVLKVVEMKFSDDDFTTVPSFAEIQHVTVALNDGVKAVDSVKALQEGTIMMYDKPLILEGKLLRYFY